ncbi:NAD(P)H-hydrate dehydratase [Sphingomonas sp. LY160]|uniref:NAD(P)H-hydrate dehydratase n=1 Tax=Sphingomonas sp. LY160 TaxID=3095342 RepID=UPI002ADEF4DA|nr:NAD(P)H-hydrate dehydratase [Sphingomonas sp. LY160]MEA1071181.1 NAD(P)H-hydrate dehydratase [Sphingomonas sp. LY160]
MTRPILTAAAMRAAEAATIAGGTSEEMLVERAGAALAEAIRRYTAPGETLVLCGPGNNGGDGYIAARLLKETGWPVRVATSAEPSTDAARAARQGWPGAVESIDKTSGAAILVDCLFGTGLTRGLEASLVERFIELGEQAALVVAADLPSGVSSDDGAMLSPIPRIDLTVAFGALKPAHRLMPAMAGMGRVVLADIGIDAAREWHEIEAPSIPPLDPAGHKFDRGLVHCLAGTMPGAIALSATAAARAGAGYVRVSTSRGIDHLPAAIVQTDTAVVNDPRVGCILVGPGLGNIPQVLTLALTAPRPVVIDADAIGHVGEPERLHGHDAILTPHEGEFVKLFGDLPGSKADRAAAAAEASKSVVIYKGADTLVASPDGRVGFAPPAPAWLATAGTGDVLAGIVAAMRARGLPSFEAACASVWIHGRAAEAAGPGMIADDLAAAIPLAMP